MTVDILVLQSTFNLHTIRCFLYLICYLGVAVDDTPQGGNALDADEQFLDYSHILTLLLLLGLLRQRQRELLLHW